MKTRDYLFATEALEEREGSVIPPNLHIVMSNGLVVERKSSIEEFGYGKGYTYVQEEFGRLLNLLTEVIKVGVNVVLTAHVPVDTPLYMYEEVNPGFVDGVLVGAWDQVYAAIREMKEKDSLVFN